MKSNQLTEFNEGGSHEQNPNGGVPIGNNNSVEQGETKKGNYIYSDRLSINEGMTKQMNLPGYIKGKTFADASKAINNKFKDRNDKYSNETKSTLLDRLTQAQETLKAEEQAKLEQIQASMAANSQQVPDQMNGEIPEGMEEFTPNQRAEGGYYDVNSPYFSEGVNSPSLIGPYNQSPISLGNAAGLNKLPNATLSAPTDMGLSAGLVPAKGAGFKSMAGNVVGGLGIANSLASGDTQGALMGGATMAAEKGLFGAGAASGLASAAPIMGGLGAVQGAIGLGSLASGVGASKNGAKSALSGAAQGAMAGSAFGPWGAGVGAAVGIGAGLMGSKAAGKKQARMGTENAHAYNNQFKDTRVEVAYGGFLNRNKMGYGGPTPMKNIVSNTYSMFNPIEGTMTDEDLTNSLVAQRNASLSGPSGATGPITQPNYYDNNKPFFTTDVANPAPAPKAPSRLSGLYNDIKENAGGLLRYAPVAMNALQLSKLHRPGFEATQKLANTYKPGYLDEASIQNTMANENANTINALTNSSGGSAATLRANILGSGVGRLKAKSDAYSRIREYNNGQDAVAQNFNLGVDQINLQQANLQQDINDKNQGNYDTQKSKLLGQIGTDLGSIGKEEVFKKLAKNMTGYTWDGQYVIDTKTGEKHTMENFAKLSDAKTKTTNRYGGFLTKNKKGY